MNASLNGMFLNCSLCEVSLKFWGLQRGREGRERGGRGGGGKEGRGEGVREWGLHAACLRRFDIRDIKIYVVQSGACAFDQAFQVIKI